MLINTQYRIAKQRLDKRRGLSHTPIAISAHDNMGSLPHHIGGGPVPGQQDYITHEEWSFERLLAHRKTKEGGDEYLVQWVPTWEKATSILWKKRGRREDCTVSEEWPVERLLDQRETDDGCEEHLVQWAPSWQKSTSISNLSEAVHSLKGTRVALRARSIATASSGYFSHMTYVRGAHLVREINF
jgi:hypothetical protein